MLSIRSLSGSKEQQIFKQWIVDYLNAKDYADKLVFETDRYGNLYVTKGKSKVYNCVVGHLDINQSKCDDFSVVIVKDTWIVGFDNIKGEQVGLGHDDKIGVYFALEMLERFDTLKCFFPLDEEIGCIGTRASEKTWFKNVGFMVQLDRRGSTDISSHTNGTRVVTNNTMSKLLPVLKEYGFEWKETMYTDVGELVKQNSKQGVNISTGYYREHSSEERLNIHEYENSQEFAYNVLLEMEGGMYNILPDIFYYKKKTNYGSSRNYTGNSTNSTVGSPVNNAYTPSNSGGTNSSLKKSYGDWDNFYDEGHDYYGYPENQVNFDLSTGFEVIDPLAEQTDNDNWLEELELENSVDDVILIKEAFSKQSMRIISDPDNSDEDVVRKLSELKDEVNSYEIESAVDCTEIVLYLSDLIEKFIEFDKKYKK